MQAGKIWFYTILNIILYEIVALEGFNALTETAGTDYRQHNTNAVKV